MIARGLCVKHAPSALNLTQYAHDGLIVDYYFFVTLINLASPLTKAIYIHTSYRGDLPCMIILILIYKGVDHRTNVCDLHEL